MTIKQFMIEPARRVICVAGMLATLIGALNSTLIFDDPFLYDHFGKILADFGFAKSIGVLFLNLDLHEGVPEYRTYGLSKLIHFSLWFMFDSKSWMYSTFIGFSQLGTALLFHFMCRSWNLGGLQSLLLALVWLLSPFAVTTCFHHYSYLILPVQITLVTAFGLRQWLQSESHEMWPAGLFLAFAGVCIGLTGELHLIFSIVVLGIVLYMSRSVMSINQRIKAYAVLVGSTLLAIWIHKQIWVSMGATVDVQRFNFSIPTFQTLTTRGFDYFISLPKGASVQLEQILSYSTTSALFTLLVCAILTSSFYFISNDAIYSFDKKPDSDHVGGANISLWIAILLIASSFGVVLVRVVFYSQVGDILPRRYGYVPYTLVCMVFICVLFDHRVKMRFGSLPAILFSTTLIGFWAALQFVCLPQVRAQDASVWQKIQLAATGKTNPSVLFVSSLNMPSPNGFDSLGLRGSKFPPLFESPFMRLGWQGQYVKTALGIGGIGNQFEPIESSKVVLNGQLEGIHFVKSPPITLPRDSLIVVMDSRYAVPAWNSDLENVKVLSRWEDFENTPAYLRVKIETGWEAMLSGIFNDIQPEVAIDLGQRAATQFFGILPDKIFEAPVITNPIIANYGLESGDDSVYSPNGNAGAPLSYFATNRHGTFTYRIDFFDRKPKLVSIDFIDWWAKSSGDRVLALQMAIGEKWVDLGPIDTFDVARRDPFSIKVPVAGVSSIRIRFRVDSTSKDIPFANGIRIKSLPTR